MAAITGVPFGTSETIYPRFQVKFLSNQFSFARERDTIGCSFDNMCWSVAWCLKGGKNRRQVRLAIVLEQRFCVAYITYAPAGTLASTRSAAACQQCCQSCGLWRLHAQEHQSHIDTQGRVCACSHWPCDSIQCVWFRNQSSVYLGPNGGDGQAGAAIRARDREQTHHHL